MRMHPKQVQRRTARFFTLFAVIFLILFTALPQFSYGAGTEQEGSDKKVVRVGYYYCDGYQEHDEKGEYWGYGYDYLREISQFAGWEYQFVSASFEDCIKMLENGDVDLVGGLDKRALTSDKIAFSHLSNSTSKFFLFTKRNNLELNFDDFEKFDGISVGVVGHCYQECYLDEYQTDNNIRFNKVYFDTAEQMEEALANDEIDAIFAEVEKNFDYNKMIAKMDEYPLYYGVNRKNKELLKELDSSMHNIKSSNPSYDIQIRNKYFIKGMAAAPAFTKEEMDYIKSKGVVKVAYDKGWQPIEYYDEKTGEIKGVTKDLFELLSKHTGLKFEFVKADTLSQALKYIKTGDADMISLVSHDYNISKERGIYTSSICINASLVGVIAKDRNFEKIEKIAMPKNYYLDILRNYKVTEYETVEECFEAVNSGAADATIANAYTANYYLANPKFVNLIRQDLIGYSEDLSLGVSDKEDIALLNVLNKGLHCISDMDMSNIILSNYVVYEQPKFRKLYYSSPGLFLSVTIISVLLIVGALVYVIMLKNKVNCTNLKMIEFLNIEKERVENSLRAEAEMDPLTGLYNRRKIETEVKEFLLKISVDNQISLQNSCMEDKSIHCMMIMDVDRFKMVNDKYGHPEGDLLLKKIAEELQLLAGEHNLAGRLGGDEFILLFKNLAGPQEARRIAQKMRKMVSDVAADNERWSDISASIGVALFGHKTYSFKELYTKADQALYRAKKSGKNRVDYYDGI